MTGIGSDLLFFINDFFHKASITLILKPDEDITENKFRLISLLNLDTIIHNNIFVTEFSNVDKD